MKTSSTSLVIREVQIKTIMRYYFTPTRMSIFKKDFKKKKISVDKDVEKLELPPIANGTLNSL